MKRIAVGFFGLLVILIAGLFMVPFFLNVNDYREFLSEKLSETSGYSVQLTGPISVTFLPTIHLTAEKMTVGVPKTNPFVQIEKAVLHMDLWPLLHKKAVINAVEVMGPTLHLIEDKKGKNNWSIQKETPDLKTKSQWETKEKNTSDFHFNIKKVRLQKGAVLTDLKGEKQTITDIDVTVLPRGGDNPFSALDLSGSLDYQKQAVSFKVLGSMTGDQLGFDGEIKTPDHVITGKGEVTSFRHIKGDIRYQGIDPKGPIAIQEGRGHLSGDLVKKIFSLKGMSLTLPQRPTISGDVTISLAEKIPFVTAHIKTGPLNVTDFMGGNKEVPTSLKTGVPVNVNRSTVWPQDPLAFDVFRTINGRFTLELPLLSYNDIALSDLRMACAISGGNFTLSSLTGGLWDGRLQASGSINPGGRFGGSVGLSLSLKNSNLVRIVPQKGSFYLSGGRLNLDGTLKTRGESIQDFVSRLNGVVSFKVNKGVVTGIDIDTLAQKATEKITPRLIFDLIQNPQLSGQTSLERLEGVIPLTNGVAAIQSLILISQTVEGRAQGTASIPAKTADITATVKLRKKPDWPAIFVRLSGPWSDLSHDINTKDVESFLLKKTLKTVLKSDIGKHLKEGLDTAGIGGILDKTGLDKIVGSHKPTAEGVATPSDKKPLEQILDKPEKAIGQLLKGLF